MDLPRPSGGDWHFMEWAALRVLRRYNPREEEQIHLLDPSELSQIQQAQRKTVMWGAVAGAISGTLIGLAEMLTRWWLQPELEQLSWRDQLPYWSAYIAVVVVVSGLEIIFLYWTALRAAAKMSAIAGLRISGKGTESTVARGLVRAALEFPNASDSIFGIDPYARVPRWKQRARLLLYRLKVGFTSFLLRVLLRRILGRAALRFFIPLLALPVFAFWNGLILYWVLIQVRIRVLGPAAVLEAKRKLAEPWKAAPEEGRRLAWEAIGETILRSEDAHPNFVLLLDKLSSDQANKKLNLDPGKIRERLAKSEEATQEMILTAVLFVSILDGKVRKSEAAWLQETHEVCGRKFDPNQLLESRRNFLRGQGISRFLQSHPR